MNRGGGGDSSRAGRDLSNGWRKLENSGKEGHWEGKHQNQPSKKRERKGARKDYSYEVVNVSRDPTKISEKLMKEGGEEMRRRRGYKNAGFKRVWRREKKYMKVGISYLGP